MMGILLSATIDEPGSLAYFKYSEANGVVETVCATDWVNIDFNRDGTLQAIEVVGFENFKSAIPELEKFGISKSHIETMSRYISAATSQNLV